MRGRAREHLMKGHNDLVKRSRRKKNTHIHTQGQSAPSGAFVLLAKSPPGAGGNR